MATLRLSSPHQSNKRRKKMGIAIVLTLNKIAILISAALLAGYFLGRWSTNNTSPSSNSSRSTAVHYGTNSNSNNGAFVLLVNMKFSSLAHRETFLKLIEPVCNDVLANEGPLSSASGSSASGGSIRSSSSSSTTEITTLSYQVAISDKDPLSIVVMERYSDKEHGYLKVHRSGDEFLKFRDRLKGMQERGDVEIVGESYFETDLGYV